MKLILGNLNDQIVGFAKSATIDTNELLPASVLDLDEANCLKVIDGRRNASVGVVRRPA